MTTSAMEETLQPGRPAGELLPVAFLARCAETPDAVALAWRDGTMSYRELAHRSAALARRLRSAGVVAETIVGIATSRSPEFVVSMLAVMQSGGAWLPLDPGYPAERLAYMMDNSGLRLVIGGTAAAGRLPQGVRCIDPDVASGDPAGDALAEVSGSDLAYVIYTSGSTGRPKGVLIEHGSVAATVAGMRDAWQVTRGDRVLQFSSASFDASICEVGIALTAGATLVFADREIMLAGPDAIELMERERVTVAVLPPSVAAALPEAALSRLRTIICAGEALPAEVAARWGKGRRLINAYGPTEAAICATSGDVAQGPDSAAKPTIGRPLSCVNLAVLGPDSVAVPPGEIGELAIGGLGVARGYLGQPELTADRFIRDATGERRYRTGDLARALPDGQYEFIGRADYQIKLRGYRIEPGEIAEVLRGHPEVRDAVVVLRGDRLAGYVAADGLSSAELRAMLAARLPAHMVPQVIVVLPELPLLPSGKVDRSALPAPDRISAGLADTQAAPHTATETELLVLMHELLGNAAIGIDDDFFALGGHSLLAGRLAIRVRSQFGVYLSLSRIYAGPTVSRMAAVIDAGGDTGGPPQPPPLRPAEPGRRIPLTFPQERVWLLDQMSPGNPAYQAQAVLRLHGPLNTGILTAVLNELVDRHDAFRTRFTDVEGEPVQQALPALRVELPVVELSGLPRPEQEAAATRIIAAEISRPFHIDRPPLARWLLLRYAPQEHALLHVEHHLVHDGWSFAVFYTELIALYEAHLAGEPPPLPEPRLRFADLAVWQRDWLRGPTLARYVDHWTARLAGAPTLELPTDRPRPAEFSFRGAALQFQMSADEYRALRACARKYGVTLFSLMFAGFAALLSRYSAQDDFMVGVGVANRRASEAERLVGMVVNTLPLRVDMSGDPTLPELLHRVHATAVDAYAWQDIPLQHLVKALAPIRDLSRNPLFSTMFSFHDSAMPDLDFGGMSGDLAVQHNGSAKSEFNVVIIPRAEQRAGRSEGDDDLSMTVIWEYATDLFDAVTVGWLAAAYRVLLAGWLADPALPLSRLPLVADSPAIGR